MIFLKKNNGLRGIVLIALIIFGFCACKDNLVETNENPNDPREVPGEFQLANSEKSGVDDVIGGLARDGASLLIHHIAKIHDLEPDRFKASSYINDADEVWPSFYERLENLKLIKNKAEDNSKPNMEAISMILTAWNYQVMTDLWGNIPYSQALKADNKNNKVVQPEYDRQKKIYNDLIKKLNSATSLIDENKSSPGQNDVIYQGNMTEWLKFANSLKLRIYMRMSEVDPTTAKDGVAKVYNNDKIFTSNSDNAVFHYGSYPYNHPTNDAMRNRYDFRVSKAIIDTLKYFDDPRLRIYAFPSEQTKKYRGVPNGAKDAMAYQLDKTSIVGGYFSSPTTPGYMMRYTEVRFILAEAAARGWIKEDPQKMYNKAIRASMKEFTKNRLNPVLDALKQDRVYTFQKLNLVDFPHAISDDEIRQYLTQSNVQYNQSNWREQIGLQRWIALYGQGLQSWFSWRRLNFPKLKLPETALLNSIPVRLFYPTLEKSLNKKNYQKAVSSQGPDNLLTHVWWDVK